MVSTASCGLVPEKLPPTESAAKYHSMRVHLQLVVWQQLDTTALEPTDWGWQMDNGSLSPITTDQPVAPDHLLKFLRCKCKKSTNNPCGTNRCTCRKFGLNCVPACGDCRGEGCKNSKAKIVEDDEDTFS